MAGKKVIEGFAFLLLAVYSMFFVAVPLINDPNHIAFDAYIHLNIIGSRLGIVGGATQGRYFSYNEKSYMLYPGIHILVSAIASLLGISDIHYLLSFQKFFIGIFSIILTLTGMRLLTATMLSDFPPSIGLLSGLLFISSNVVARRLRYPIPETLAYPLLLFAMYFALEATKRVRWLVLTVIFLVLTGFTHHLTTFMALAYVTVIWVFQAIREKTFKSKFLVALAHVFIFLFLLQDCLREGPVLFIIRQITSSWPAFISETTLLSFASCMCFITVYPKIRRWIESLPVNNISAEYELGGVIIALVLTLRFLVKPLMGVHPLMSLWESYSTILLVSLGFMGAFKLFFEKKDPRAYVLVLPAVVLFALTHILSFFNPSISYTPQRLMAFAFIPVSILAALGFWNLLQKNKLPLILLLLLVVNVIHTTTVDYIQLLIGRPPHVTGSEVTALEWVGKNTGDGYVGADMRYGAALYGLTGRLGTIEFFYPVLYSEEMNKSVLASISRYQYNANTDDMVGVSSIFMTESNRRFGLKEVSRNISERALMKFETEPVFNKVYVNDQAWVYDVRMGD